MSKHCTSLGRFGPLLKYSRRNHLPNRMDVLVTHPLPPFLVTIVTLAYILQLLHRLRHKPCFK